MKKRVIGMICATLALGTGLVARATEFVKDVMLIGGSADEVNALKTTYLSQGWTFYDYNLNKGAGGDYIYLLYKHEQSDGGNYGYVTDFYIKTGSSGVDDTLTIGGKTYYLTPYDGGSHFKGQKGDLNSNVGGDTIHLYYTKDVSAGHAVSRVRINADGTGAVGKDGDMNSGYDLNKNAGGGFVYLHYETASASMTVNLGALTRDCTAIDGMTLTGTLSASVNVRIAAGAAVTLSNATINARSGMTSPGIACEQGATILLIGANSVTGSNSSGIYVPSGSALNVGGTGSLVATGTGNSAGIGGYAAKPSCGDITLQSGTVTAVKGDSAPYSIGNAGSGTCGTVKVGSVTTGAIAQNPVTFSSTDTTVYTAAFNANGGTGSTAPIQSRLDTPCTIPATGFSRFGYSFAGWNAAADGSGASYAVGQYVILGNATIYARWSPVTYNISYDLAGGSLPNGASNPGTYNVETATFTLNEPTRANCIFAGWTDGNGSNPQFSVSIAQGSTGDRSYVATWTPVVFALTNQSEDVLLLDGQTLTGTGGANTHIVVAADATVTLRDVDLAGMSGTWAGITCLGNATFTLRGTNVVRAAGSTCPGIQAGPAGSTLTICGDGALGVQGGANAPAIAVGANVALDIADGLKVTADGVPVACGGRAAGCAGNEVRIGPCAHDGGVSTQSRHAYCAFCGVEVPWFFGSGGDGTAASPWLISSQADWNELADAVAAGFTGVGRNFQLADGISVTAAVGTVAHPFCGAFDGGGKTLIVEIDGEGDYVAPFSVISNATVSGLVVTGGVRGNMHCAGLVGFAAGTNLVEDCLVSATVSSSGTRCGGMLGHGGSSATTFRGCVFSGRTTELASASTIWGWSDEGASAVLVDCLDDSVASRPVGHGGYGSLLVENVYYTYSEKEFAGNSPWPPDKRGKFAYSVAAGDGVTIGFGTPKATYATSGITAYEQGLAHGGTFYAGANETVALSLSAAGAVEFEVADGTLARDGDAWTLAMPAADVVIEKIPLPPHPITFVEDENCNAGRWIYRNGCRTNVLEAVFTDQVRVEYACSFGFRIVSITVTAADGSTIPCAVEPGEDGIADSLAGTFRMPDAPVTVSATLAAVSYDNVTAGVAASVTEGIYRFVAPATGTYSVGLSDPAVWEIMLCTEKGLPVYDTANLASVGDPVLIGGATYYVVSSPHDGETSATLTITKTADAPLYPISVLPAEHGTAEIAESAAPEGYMVLVATHPDPGWTVQRCRVVGPGGEQVFCMDASGDGSFYVFFMPAGAASVSLEFDRSHDLAMGENPILFVGEAVYEFWAPATGWYCFSSADRGELGIGIYDEESGALVNAECHWDESDNFHVLVPLVGGRLYAIKLYCDFYEPVEASIVVSRPERHDISFAGGIAHGEVAVRPASGGGDGKALEGTAVWLDVSPDVGYESGALNVIDATGGVARVRWDGPGNGWYFIMPGTNVIVSATFGAPHVISAEGGSHVYWNAMTVNGDWAPRAAAAGAEVVVGYWCELGWDVQAFAVTTEDGAPVPFSVETYDDSPYYYSVVFTMPDAPVTVVPEEVRADYPTLALGDNRIAKSDVYSFTAPTNGIYTLTTTNDYSDIYAYDSRFNSWGDGDSYPRGEWVGPLVGGDHIYLEVLVAHPIDLKIERTGDYVTYPIVVSPDAVGIFTTDVSEAAEDDTVHIHFMAELDDDSEVLVRDADGNIVKGCYFEDEEFHFCMPPSSVTICLARSHAVALDAGIAHGEVEVYCESSGGASKALEGSTVWLDVSTDGYYELGALNVIDATGGVVSVSWDDYDDGWYFTMPGTNVTVSATFGVPHLIVAMDDLRAMNYETRVNGQSGLLAAAGAEVRVEYGYMPGWEIASFAVTAANGASVPYAVEASVNGPYCRNVVFTMPDAFVSIVPTVARADCPTLGLGSTTISEEGVWTFVAPATGEYSITLSDMNVWDFDVHDDWGSFFNDWSNDVCRLKVTEGEICHLFAGCAPGAEPTVVTIAKTGDATPYSITIAPDSVGKIRAYPSVAYAGRNVILTAAPGYELDSDPVVEGPSGNSAYIYNHGIDFYSFRMPESDVTVTATFRAALPSYLWEADDRVGENYYTWAEKYGPDVDGTHKTAFLLDIDPATPIPEGAALLKVTDFSMSSTQAHIEIGSDIAEFKQKGDGEYSLFLGNGYLMLRATPALSSDPDDWMTSPALPVKIRNGRAVIDSDLGPAKEGATKPPSLFFQPVLIDRIGPYIPPSP